MRRTVDYGIRHRVTRAWVGRDGHTTMDIAEAKSWTSHDRAAAYRRRYLESFAPLFGIEPLPSPEPAKAA